MFRALCAHRQEAKIVLYSLWYHHTYRWPSRAQVERGHIIKFSASSWLILRQNWIVFVYSSCSNADAVWSETIDAKYNHIFFPRFEIVFWVFRRSIWRHGPSIVRLVY